MPYLIILLLAIGMLVTHVLMGGVKLVFSLPGYFFVSVAAALAFFLPVKCFNLGARRLPVMAALLLATYVTIRAHLSPVPYLARHDIYMVLAALIVYLITVSVMGMARQRWVIMWLLILVSCVSVVSGFIQFKGDDNFMLLSRMPSGSPLPELFRPDYGWRASGFLACPNHLAGLLECVALLTLAACVFARCKATFRVFMAYVFLMCAAGLAITGSRGGYLSVLCGIGILVLAALWIVRRLRPKKIWIALVCAGIIAITGIGGVIYAMSKSSLIQQRMDTVIEPTNMRLHMWKASLKQFQLSPVVGTGAGTYIYYGRQFREASVQNDPIHVHNDYLEILAEYGVIGAGLMLFFIVTHLHSGWRGIASIIRRRLRPAGRIFSDELALSVGAFAAVVALIAHSVVDFNFQIPGNTLFFSFLLGILAAPTSDPNVLTDPNKASVQVARFLLPAVGVLVLVMGVPQLRGEYHAEWARVFLRNAIYANYLAQVQSASLWPAPLITVGTPQPAVGVASHWVEHYQKDYLFPKSLQRAEKALETEKQNPDIYYYIGEANHFLAMLETDPARRKALHARSGDAYRTGLLLFPQDARLQMKYARALDNLGLLDEAEEMYQQALAADPNLGNLYSQYGYHLFLRRKIVRAEAYYRRALQLYPYDAVAKVGIEDILRIRALAANPRFVEEYGDPLEDFDLEMPTPEDEARQVQVFIANDVP